MAKSKFSHRVLIVDDSEANRNALRDLLAREGYMIDLASSGPEALTKLRNDEFSLVLCDVRMDGMDGIEVLNTVYNENISTSFIMVTGEAGVEEAVKATRLGAFDFFIKPLDINRFLIAVRNAVEKASLITETKILKRKISNNSKAKEIIGESEAIRKIKSMIQTVASKDVRVLITGPNGSGKELVAQSIHDQSLRSDKPMIEVNCAAIPRELLESELFGHEKGAFTGAISARDGKFIAAEGGTLFLDEIGDMSHEAQAAVLRALESNEIMPVGANKIRKVNVRVIAATNKNLLEEIKLKNFREDLYHRLAVVNIHVPPLNERKSDIPILANSFLQHFIDSSNSVEKRFTDNALRQLQEYDWTGNIRELRNVVERLFIFGGNIITEHDVIEYTGTTSKDTKNSSDLIPVFETLKTMEDVKRHFEREYLKYMLEKHNGSFTKTADAIGMQRTYLHKKAAELGLKLED